MAEPFGLPVFMRGRMRKSGPNPACLRYRVGSKQRTLNPHMAEPFGTTSTLASSTARAPPKLRLLAHACNMASRETPLAVTTEEYSANDMRVQEHTHCEEERGNAHIRSTADHGARTPNHRSCSGKEPKLTACGHSIKRTKSGLRPWDRSDLKTDRTRPSKMAPVAHRDRVNRGRARTTQNSCGPSSVQSKIESKSDECKRDKKSR